MIEQVENFGSELQPELFLDWKLLEKGEIHSLEVRSEQLPAVFIPKCVGCELVYEATRIEPFQMRRV